MNRLFSISTVIYLSVFVTISCRQKVNTEDKVSTTDSISKVTDPLPSWKDGALKTAITGYVKKITKEGSPDYIPKEDRIATFDNDGTLWAEKPYVQELFAFFMAKKMVEKNPALASKQPFKAVIENDKNWFAKGGMNAFLELIMVTHTGMTEDAFSEYTKEFYSSATFPGRNVPIRQITYKPQLELLQYLRDNGFKTFICTGGTIEFVRSISQEFYGIPPDQVIGTSFKYEFIDSSNVIYRNPAMASFNDKTAKPGNIQLHIGKKPVFACGNEGGAGDIAMLEFSQTSTYPTFQLLVNHNDSIREYAYAEKDTASLKAAAKNNWHVVSMKDDWKTIFTE